VVAPISPRSAEEALAQFALAFALLQPEETYEILHPLLLMGQSYQSLFGATLPSTSESLEYASRIYAREGPIMLETGLTREEIVQRVVRGLSRRNFSSFLLEVPPGCNYPDIMMKTTVVNSSKPSCVCTSALRTLQTRCSSKITAGDHSFYTNTQGRFTLPVMPWVVQRWQ
jgi:hypothetical protein